MKHAIAIIAFLPLLAFAQRVPERENLEKRVLSTLREARQAISENLQLMSERDLRKVEKLLDRARLTAEGQDDEDNTPVPRVLKCSEEGPDLFHSTFNKMKAFAYSTLGVSTSESLNYATAWTNEHPCALADKFMNDFKRIKSFAYQSLGVSTSESNNYAKAMVSKLCSEVKFEEIYSKHYSFAYSSLGYSTSSSRQYAQPKMEAQAFVCRNF